jgi:hypothetical protein
MPFNTTRKPAAFAKHDGAFTKKKKHKAAVV